MCKLVDMKAEAGPVWKCGNTCEPQEQISSLFQNWPGEEATHSSRGLLVGVPAFNPSTWEEAAGSL